MRKLMVVVGVLIFAAGLWFVLFVGLEGHYHIYDFNVFHLTGLRDFERAVKELQGAKKNAEEARTKESFERYSKQYEEKLEEVKRIDQWVGETAKTLGAYKSKAYWGYTVGGFLLFLGIAFLGITWMTRKKPQLIPST